MRLATIRLGDVECGGIVCGERIMTLERLNRNRGTQYATDLLALIRSGQLPELGDWYREEGMEWLYGHRDDMLRPEQIHYAPLYRRPDKIFGIGLNYVDHAKDLETPPPTAFPGSFFKPSTTIVGDADGIKLPQISQKTTGEAELGVILGKRCRNIDKRDWLSYVAGFTTVLDMTAEDLVRQNPRFLTLAKSFDTFFSFGPELVTPDEIGEVGALRISTVLNGRVYAQNTVSNMRFPPDELLAFHSRVMTWMPGDVLSTGTPRAAALAEGDIIECRIDGLRPLKNPVVGL